MAAMSVAATAAMSVVPAAGQDWGADEDGSRAVVSDSGIELVDPPSPAGTGSSPTPSFAADPIDGRGSAAVDSSLPYDSSATARGVVHSTKASSTDLERKASATVLPAGCPAERAARSTPSSPSRTPRGRT